MTEPRVEAGDRALETARKLSREIAKDVAAQLEAQGAIVRHEETDRWLPLIQSAMNAQERELLILAGRLLESQWPEWGDVDGASIEEWLIECGLLKSVDVTEPCDPEDCVCAEFGFPTKCNRRTELGERAERLLADRGEGQ